MSKVFRLHTGNNTITDWQTSEKYGANVINQIKDPDGATATKEITSIPSPFARMDLVKTAFRYLTESRQIDGTTIYHKMVSDTLDVGEIFFNIDSLSDKIQILFWDTDNLQEMRSSSEGHRSLAATLEMYLGEDATAYNFDRMKRICLLNYIGADRPAPMNIIGATSPATLFFCSANRLAYVSNHILFGQHKTFSDEFTPLYARDFAYQKFLYAFVKYYGKDFATHFPEVYDYLEQNYQFLPDERKTEISALTEESIHEFEELTVGSNSVEVLGCRLRKRPKTNRIKSEFEIASTLYVAHESDKRPLVLPVEAGNSYTSLRYVSSRWDKHFKAPYADAAAWESRSLPYANEKYPYLTISDFLEDTIIRLPASFSSDSFFEGNKEEGMAESYLLPLTDLFFSFFSVADLMRPLVGGKPMLELRKNAGGVKVILRIPINEARDFVEYARIFFENRTAVLENNTGKLIEESARDFGFALFPSIRYADARDASYRFGLTTPFAAREHYTADYYAAGKKLISQAVVRNGQYKQAPAATYFVLENSNFDYIRLRGAEQHSGVLIPYFTQQGNGHQFTFAIDLGTTNTHIEYSVDGTPAVQLEVRENEKQISGYTNSDDSRYLFDFDLVPEVISDEAECKFPLRTALAEANDINWSGGVFPFASANAAIPYERRSENIYNRVITELKWSAESNNMQRMKCYIESLFMLLRHKVILNNGNLQRTRIVWFYPISMTQHRFSLYKQTWEDAYRKFFGADVTHVPAITESIAPFEYYKKSKGNVVDLVSVDIGGGSTDIVITRGGEVKYITSFRFAANALFGDGLLTGNIGMQNGIIRTYRARIMDSLRSDPALQDLQNILRTLEARSVSADIATFFFSLRTNKDIIAKHLEEQTNFQRMLQSDEKQKAVFLIFYVALIYHLATLMKLKGLPLPRHIAFSGNGSKVIQILTPDNDLLERFTKRIFEKIYGESWHADGLSIYQNTSNPKEVTCKGGIVMEQARSYSDVSDAKVVLFNHQRAQFTDGETYRDIQRIKDECLEQTVEDVRTFLRFLMELSEDFHFGQLFGVSDDAWERVKSNASRDLANYAARGWEQKMREVAPSDHVEETLFFYPVTGIIHALSDILI